MINESILHRRQIKDKIQNLINSGQLEDAEKLLNEYFISIKNDPEAFSIKSVLLLLQQNIDEAENVLVDGLKLEPFNKDLLFNMSYLMDTRKKSSEALQFYCKAKLFHPNSDVRVQDIIQNLSPIDERNYRVLHGTIEIANQMHTITEGLKSLGVITHTLNYYPNYLGYKSDYTLDLNNFMDNKAANTKTKNLAAKLIEENDVFHFHFGTSLTLDYSDLPLIKELKKKVIMQYWGSDVRMYSKAVKLNPYVNVKIMDEDLIKRKLEFISSYIPDCLVDYELAEYVKDFHPNIHLTRVAIDINEYKFAGETQNEKLLIVHAPTSPEFKGTSYILRAIGDLKEKYDFDFKLIQGMSHAQAVKIYEKADFIIDQVLAGSYGVFAVEAMAMGKPVICWIDDFMKERYPDELPIISANPDNLKEKIEYAIKNKDMLIEKGVKCRKYVEKYHDINIVSQHVLDIYKCL